MAEECDDGDVNTHSGCASCLIKRGYKCSSGTNCSLACGDEVVDASIPGTNNGVAPSYHEQCDDGNQTPGDGCGASCQLEPPPRTYPYPNADTIVEELLVPGGTTAKADCKAPYLPAQSGTHYNPAPTSGMVCYLGNYCLDCTAPKFPGYPLSALYKFVAFSPYSNIAEKSTGRLRAIVFNDTFYAFDYVGLNSDVLVTAAGVQADTTNGGLGVTRQTFGKYFVKSLGETDISIKYIQSDGTISTAQTLLTFRNKAPQLGMEFYIWWPGANYLLSRMYNGKTFEVYSFHTNTMDIITDQNTHLTDPRPDDPLIRDFNIYGDILMDPVFRLNNMYVPVFTSDASLTPVTAYKVLVFSYNNSPWEIALQKTVPIAAKIISMVSFADAVIVTTDAAAGANNFYNVDAGASVTPTLTGATPACVFPWKFIQARPHPDDPTSSPPAYVFCEKYKLYPVTFASSTLTIDTVNVISLPDDDRDSRHKTGRFNLGYPYDISGNILVNFSIHKCADYIMYRWDEWKKMSVSIYNFATKTTKCINVMNVGDPF